MAENTAVKEKEAAVSFGATEKKLLKDPLSDNNPITIQVLGICSALAVTTQVVPSFILAIAVVFVTASANLTISLLRSSIPKEIRMIVQLVVIATLVTVVELVLKAADFNSYKQLSVFIGLIITNCIVMGRLEAFAMSEKNKPWQAFLDGIGNGLGYGWIIIAVAVLREFFGSGSLAGFQIISTESGTNALINTADISWLSWYAHNNLMVLPASALFVIGIFIWIQRSMNKKLVDIS